MAILVIGCHWWSQTTRYSGQALAECVVNDTTCEPSLVLSGCFPTTPCDFPDIDPCQHDVTDCPSDGKMLSGSSCQVKCKAPYFPPLGEAHGSIECRDPNIDPLGAIWTPPSCILGCSEPSSQTGYRNILGEWQCADGYDGAGAGFETGGCGSGFGPTVLYLWETYTVYKLQ